MKSRDTLTPIGPWIVAKEAIPDPHNLALRTWVNGELRQQGTTADLIFSIPFLIAYLSEFMTLQPGDMIATGTPKGLSDVVPGDEVIVPAFTYIAAAEVALALGLVPVLVDVDPGTFNIDPEKIEDALSEKTRAIIAVHLFGQCCDMESILSIAGRHNLYVIEDNAQSIGANYTFSNGTVKKAGTIASIGTTSFFPSKPLACYGDGGAMFTSDARLAERLRMIANHGQKVKYHHALVGCNSRLDTLQAAVLDVKLRYLDEFAAARCKVAARYDAAFSGLKTVRKPLKSVFSSHVYHQYTVQLAVEKRDQVQAALKERGIPSMIYYPLPLQEQEVMRGRCRISGDLNVASRLSRSVLSLPIHTEMTEEEQAYIIESIKSVL